MKRVIKIVCILIVICIIALGVLGYINLHNNQDNIEGQDNNEKTGFNTNGNTLENESTIPDTEKEESTTINTEGINTEKGWVGNQYINKSKNIIFNLPEGWNKYTTEEIKKIINEEAQELTEEEKSTIDKYTNYDMMASDKTGVSNVIITINEIEEEITANKYLSELKKALNIVDVLEYEFGDIYSTNICGVEYEALELKVKDYPLQQHYYVRIEEKELIGIVITTNTNENLNEILKSFE